MKKCTTVETTDGGRAAARRRYVSERELFEYCGIAVRTLQRWRLDPNAGPPWVKFGGAVKYDLDRFEEWTKGCPCGGQR
jgi:hypothetical protein